MRSSPLKLVLYFSTGAFLLWALLSVLRLHRFPAKLSSSLPLAYQNSQQQHRFTSSGSPAIIHVSAQELHTFRHDNESDNYVTTWHATLADLAGAAQRDFSNTFASSDLAELGGFPGTSITDSVDAKALQAYLDCSASEGTWHYDALGDLSNGLTAHKQSPTYATCDRNYYQHRKLDGSSPVSWDVRESLKYRWRPDAKCSALLPARLRPANQYSSTHTLPSRQALCGLLQNKYVLLVGDQPTQFYLHDLLLDWTNDAQDSCYGDLYCGLHSICGAFVKTDSPAVDEPGGRWQDDVLPYDRLALSPAELEAGKGLPIVNKMPLPKKQQDYSTALRYRRSDGLWLGADHRSPQVDAVYKNSLTDVREINQYVFPDLARSDIVVLSKAPFPLPALSSPFGPDVRSILNAPNTLHQAQALLALAAKMTKEAWLPEVMQALYDARVKASQENLIVWRGNWRMHPDCSTGHLGPDSQEEQAWWRSPGDGPPPHPRIPSLKQAVFPHLYSSSSSSSQQHSSEDLHAIFYNVQLVLQNSVIRTEILPNLGIPYLDMETPMSVWRSGMVSGTSYVPGADHPSSKPGARNCLEPCIPSAGMSAEEGFIGGLHRLLQSGWGNEQALKSWTGTGYTPVRRRS